MHVYQSNMKKIMPEKTSSVCIGCKRCLKIGHLYQTALNIAKNLNYTCGVSYL